MKLKSLCVNNKYKTIILNYLCKYPLDLKEINDNINKNLCSVNGHNVIIPFDITIQVQTLRQFKYKFLYTITATVGINSMSAEDMNVVELMLQNIISKSILSTGNKFTLSVDAFKSSVIYDKKKPYQLMVI